MAKLTTDELIDAFKEMTLIELSEFVSTFGLRRDCRCSGCCCSPAGGAGENAGEAEEKTEFDVVITEIGDKKIRCIKEVRGLTSLGLKSQGPRRGCAEGSSRRRCQGCCRQGEGSPRGRRRHRRNR